MVTLTATEFNRAPSAVRRAVLESDEPVLVTDRATPSLIVMKYIDFVHLTSRPVGDDLASWLELDYDIDFEPVPVSLGLSEVEL